MRSLFFIFPCFFSSLPCLLHTYTHALSIFLSLLVYLLSFLQLQLQLSFPSPFFVSWFPPISVVRFLRSTWSAINPLPVPLLSSSAPGFASAKFLGCLPTTALLVLLLHLLWLLLPVLSAALAPPYCIGRTCDDRLKRPCCNPPIRSCLRTGSCISPVRFQL